MYCDEHLCMSVCLSARLISKTTSRNFLYLLPVAMARSSFEYNAINLCSMLPVCGDVLFHIMGQIVTGRRKIIHRDSTDGATWNL